MLYHAVPKQYGRVPLAQDSCIDQLTVQVGVTVHDIGCESMARLAVLGVLLGMLLEAPLSQFTERQAKGQFTADKPQPSTASSPS